MSGEARGANPAADSTPADAPVTGADEAAAVPPAPSEPPSPEPSPEPRVPDEFARPENEDDDGYDPWSDRRPEPEPLFERDPWS